MSWIESGVGIWMKRQIRFWAVFSSSITSMSVSCIFVGEVEGLQLGRALDNQNCKFLCDFCRSSFKLKNNLSCHIKAKHWNLKPTCVSKWKNAFINQFEIFEIQHKFSETALLKSKKLREIIVNHLKKLNNKPRKWYLSLRVSSTRIKGDMELDYINPYFHTSPLILYESNNVRSDVLMIRLLDLQIEEFVELGSGRIFENSSLWCRRRRFRLIKRDRFSMSSVCVDTSLWSKTIVVNYQGVVDD